MLSSASTSYETPSDGHLAFLTRVAHDPEFRAALEADPRAALASFGLSVGSEDIPSTVTLPSAENILDVLIDTEDQDQGVHKSWFGFLGQ